MGQKQEIDLKELFAVVLSRIYIVIIFCIAGFAAAFSYAKFVLPLEYTSSVNMYVKNSNEADNNTTVIDNQTLTTSRNLVDTYIVVLSDDSVMQQISNELMATYSADELSQYFNIEIDENGNSLILPKDIRSCISMSSVNQTEVMNISVKTANAQLSADICSIMSEIAPSELLRVVGATSAETIGTAAAAKQPSGPNIKKFSLLGFGAGFIIAIAIIIIVYLTDNTVSDSESLKKNCDMSVLAEIPDIFADIKTGYGNETQKNSEAKVSKKQKNSSASSRKKSKNKDTVVRSTILSDNMSFAVTEAYKSLRTNLIFAISTGKSNIIEISSCNASEGKSTTSINTAISFAQAQSHVLLIDCDLRKPVDHRSFKLKNDKGLTTVLSGTDKLEDCIAENVAENLDFLPAGPTPPNPAEMLGSEKMKNILKDFSAKYDYVILDTPPGNIVSDAYVLSDMIAGIIVVCKQASTTFDDLKRIKEKMSLSNTNNLGAVITNCTMKNSKGGKYSYYKGYGYGEYK